MAYYSAEDCKTLRDELVPAFNKWLKKEYGVTMEIVSGIRYGDALTARMRIKPVLSKKAAEKQKKADADKAKNLWKVMAKRFGLEPDWFGKSFKHKRTTFKIVGINPRRRKNCVMLRNDAGKQLICSPAFVQMYLSPNKTRHVGVS